MLNETIEDLGPRVPAICEHPECSVEITRGRVNTCGMDPAGGDGGCGLVFCGAHLQGPRQTCECCAGGMLPFDRKTAAPDWTDFKLTGEAWAEWRRNNPEAVIALATKKGAQMREQHAAHETEPVPETIKADKGEKK